MKKGKFIAAGLIVVLIFAVVIACSPPSIDHVKVTDEISPSDLAELKIAIRRETWRQTLPDYSWSSIKNLPEKLFANQKKQILEIIVDRRTHSMVALLGVGEPGKTDPSSPEPEIMVLRHDQHGWHQYPPAFPTYDTVMPE